MAKKLTSLKDNIPTQDNPKVLEIELTDYCNIKCIMCHVAFEGQKPVHSIDLSVLQSVADSTYNTEIKFGVNYEATLHKQYIDVINMFSKNGNKITLNSNGTKWTKEMFDGLKGNNHIYRIAISIDSLQKETYKKIRQNDGFEDVYNTLITLGDIFKDSKTIVATNLVLNRSNLPELIDFVDFCHKYGIDNIQTVPMVIVSLENKGLLDESLYPIRDTYLHELDKAMEYIIVNNIPVALTSSYTRETPLREKYPENFVENAVITGGLKDASFLSQITRLQLLEKDDEVFCISPWVYSRIYPNGDVELCRSKIAGNLYEESFEKIWHGQNAQKIRDAVVKDDNTCKSCDFYRYAYHLDTVDIKAANHFFTDAILKDHKADELFTV